MMGTQQKTNLQSNHYLHYRAVFPPIYGSGGGGGNLLCCSFQRKKVLWIHSTLRRTGMKSHLPCFYRWLFLSCLHWHNQACPKLARVPSHVPTLPPRKVLGIIKWSWFLSLYIAELVPLPTLYLTIIIFQ